jgi:DNA ligase-3
MTENRFSVDYAKLGTSSCKKCKAKIAKGEIRIAKITPSPFSEGDTMKVYHHVACIFETFLHARATTKIIESSTDLDGWLNISPADREIIAEQIKQVQTARANKSPTKKVTKSVTATVPKQKTPTKKVSPPKTIPISTEDDDESTIDYDDIEAIDNKEDAEEIKPTDGVHVPLNDDPKHPDNSFRQFRGLCTKLAETNGHLAKTSIVEQFITYGCDGESYKGENIQNF